MMGNGETTNYDMEYAELTKIIFNRVQKIEPENVVKIMGCMLLTGPKMQEMIHLACGSDAILQSKIADSKILLNVLWPKTSADPHHLPENLDFVPPLNDDSLMYHHDAPNPSRVKICHYFLKGYCKHGSSCRYFHGYPNGNEFENEGYGFSYESLENLEMEIVDLLRSRRGAPVSVASLPRLYFEKYGRNVHMYAENQRNWKSGVSLARMLARLKNSLCVIERTPGQQCVILAEDAHKYMRCRNDRSDLGAVVTNSHQIYLTFPAESTFTEDDVSKYFER